MLISLILCFVVVNKNCANIFVNLSSFIKKRYKYPKKKIYIHFFSDTTFVNTYGGTIQCTL